MALTLIPPPTRAQISARVEDLPYGMAGMVRSALAQAGTTSDHLLFMADAMDEARRDIAVVFPAGSSEADMFADAASILRDAAPLFPHPARLPAAPISALDADRSTRAPA